MDEKTRTVPEGYHSVTPLLVVHDVSRALEFYSRAFGAKELSRMPGEDGTIFHAELRIGDSRIMISDEKADMGVERPHFTGGAAASLYLYVQDVDLFVKNAVAAGAELTRSVEDQFYGDRSGTLEDPFGYTWCIATRKEDLSPEEIKTRAKRHAA